MLLVEFFFLVNFTELFCISLIISPGGDYNILNKLNSRLNRIGVMSVWSLFPGLLLIFKRTISLINKIKNDNKQQLNKQQKTHLKKKTHFL